MLLCFSLAACGGGGSSSPPAVAPTTWPTQTVNIKQPYNDTGFALTAGEKVTITATGTFESQCATCSFSPDGAAWTACSNDRRRHS